MHIARKSLLAAAAGLTLAAVCGFAEAKDALHTLTVKAPDGGTVVVHYAGDVAPRVSFGTAPETAGFADFASPFAMMARMRADMDRQMDLMMRQANAMMAGLPARDPIFRAGFFDMPLAMPDLSAIADGGKAGFCMKSVEITSTGDGGKPKIVTHVAGNCGPSGKAAAPAEKPAGTGRKLPI
jgi:hypothetical protein